jgi:hypothetical protein
MGVHNHAGCENGLHSTGHQEGQQRSDHLIVGAVRKVVPEGLAPSLPPPYTGKKTLTKKVSTEREHAEWTAKFLAIIDQAAGRSSVLRELAGLDGLSTPDLLRQCPSVMRFELGRYKISAGYRRFWHQDRHIANSSFTLGMVASIADKLKAMKRERDAVNYGTGRDLVVLKASVVDAELEKLDLKLRTVRRTTRMVVPAAYEAGGVAGASLAINPGIRGT